MTGQELVDAVKDNVQQDGVGPFTDAQILDIVNEGYVDFYRYVRPTHTQTTLAAASYQSMFTLPSNFTVSTQYRWGSQYQVFPKPERQLDYDQRDWKFKVGPTPENLVYWKWNCVRVTPVPSAAGTFMIRYFPMPTALTLSGTPVLQKMWHNALEHFATAQVFFIYREFDQANWWWGKYLEGRKQARSSSGFGRRTQDTLVSQSPVTIFDYQNWDPSYRMRS